MPNADDRDRFVEQVISWIEDPLVLSAARELLRSDLPKSAGGSRRRENLGERQIANWRDRAREPTGAGPQRRLALPESLLEGAALSYCALDAHNPTGMSAKRFFQAFLVSEESHDGKHDCRVYRYWEHVRSVDAARPRYLTHKTWFNGDSSKLLDLAEPQRPPLPEFSAEDGNDVIAGFTRLGEAVPPQASQHGGGTSRSPVGEGQSDASKSRGSTQIAVTWKVRGHPGDYGYRTDIERAIQRDDVEYVGGKSTIPAEKAVLMLYLPRSLLEKLPVSNEPLHPQYMATHADGDPLVYIRRYADEPKEVAD